MHCTEEMMTSQLASDSSNLSSESTLCSRTFQAAFMVCSARERKEDKEGM